MDQTLSVAVGSRVVWFVAINDFNSTNAARCLLNFLPRLPSPGVPPEKSLKSAQINSIPKPHTASVRNADPFFFIPRWPIKRLQNHAQKSPPDFARTMSQM